MIIQLNYLSTPKFKWFVILNVTIDSLPLLEKEYTVVTYYRLIVYLFFFFLLAINFAVFISIKCKHHFERALMCFAPILFYYFHSTISIDTYRFHP